MNWFKDFLFRLPPTDSPDDGVLWAACWGVILGLAFSIYMIFFSGLTFGDRCAVHYAVGSAQWETCVDNLSKGLPGW